MSFLKAKWEDLVFINYKIDPQILAPYVPFGTELDFFQDECWISLVGFMFRDTSLLGLKFPYHTHFEEINLRFYVKKREQNKDKRGVVFLKEIVPKPIITFIANTLYSENYETMKMSHSISKDFIKYEFGKKNLEYSFSAPLTNPFFETKENTLEEFITEHYWGYAQVNSFKTNEYEVTHPKWKCQKVFDAKININFEQVYGSDFGFITNQTPDSILYAKGSEITVEPKSQIK